MTDRLNQLLTKHERLYGVICRDATLTEVELMAQVGYHIVWIDLEHSPQSTSEAIRLGRSIVHLGMVPLVRIPELSRTHVQILLDGGIQGLVLPDVKNVGQVKKLVHMGKYPPLGGRGISSTPAGTGFTLGVDAKETLREANDGTHLMALFESDEGYEALDRVLEVEGIDMVSVGANDWSVGLGLFGDEAKAHLAPKIERVIETASRTGKIVSMGASNSEEANYYYNLGVRVFFLGVDINIKRRMLTETLSAFQE